MTRPGSPRILQLRLQSGCMLPFKTRRSKSWGPGGDPRPHSKPAVRQRLRDRHSGERRCGRPTGGLDPPMGLAIKYVDT